MQALISTTELRETGYRIAQVAADADVFPVASEMFWVVCADNIVADQFWYDPSDSQIKAFPVLPEIERPRTEGLTEV